MDTKEKVTEWLWKKIAWVASRRRVTAWLIRCAQRTPYLHIYSPDGTQVYMYRWWLFNAYDNETRQTKYRWCPVSIRLHRIMTPDNDRHLHDHPWDARTIILKGWYQELRQGAGRVMRYPGHSAAIGYGEYHQIRYVCLGGAWTLFITGKYRGTWGFLVDGKKVPYKEYLE
jgi:hypothetical protein